MKTGLLKSILHPHDGTRRAVKEQVVTSRQEVQKAVTRFEETIRDLIKKNDLITGRQNDEKPQHQ
jgi:hypothetical protein